MTEHLKFFFGFRSAKHVLEVEDVFKVLLYSKMHFNSLKLPDKTHHTYLHWKEIAKMLIITYFKYSRTTRKSAEIAQNIG